MHRRYRITTVMLCFLCVLGACKSTSDQKERPEEGASRTAEDGVRASRAETESARDSAEASAAARAEQREKIAAAAGRAGEELAGGVEAARSRLDVSVDAEGPLGEVARAIFWGTAEDPAAEKLLGVNEEYEGRHYLTGDEWNLHLFYEHIKDLGGGFVGVGTDQTFLLIGWQRPELAWLFDYDPWVHHLQHAYIAFFEAADTPREFKRYWWRKKAAIELLEKRYADHPDRENIVKLYEMARGKVRYRLKLVEEKIEKLAEDEEDEDGEVVREGVEYPTFLTDQETYDFIKKRIEQKRVRPLQGNLLEDRALIGVGRAARALDVPVRVAYLSNAEQYWKYKPQYRENFKKMYFDDKSLILRTFSTWSINKDYTYNVQKALDYVEWLEREWVEKVTWIVPKWKPTEDEDIAFREVERDIEQLEKWRNRNKKDDEEDGEE
jgi:hypothetical protein